MPGIAFERPILVLAAILLPFAIVIARRFFRDAFSLSLTLGPPGGVPFKAPIQAGIFVKFARFLEIIGASIMLLAASGPELLSNSFVYLDRGADILFVLDDSPSMAGLDIGGRRRFDAARELIRDFSAKRPTDAIGLVILGDEAALLLPPTTDRNTFFSRLDKLQIGEMGDGTALGMGLSVASLHLKNSSAPRKAVVLITDGENNAGAVHPETAAASLVGENISLYVIAVGTAGEVPIDYVDPYTHVRRTGSFESRFNPDILAKTAIAGAGEFIPAPSPEAFSEAFSRVNRGEMTISRSGMRGKRTAVSNMLLLAGLFLFSLAIVIKKLFLGAFL
jgi:Ca-activated chloride channel family protein